jgi:hypothetical protein
MSVMWHFLSLLALWRRDSAGNVAVFSALALIPLLTLTGAAVDFGMSLYARQRLDAAVQSAAAAAIAQARALRAARAEVSDFEFETRGRSRADLVFNAQKPSVRNVRTQFSMTRSPATNTYLVNIEYEAAIGTVFLRLAGISELNLRGSASASWIARDAIFEERFETYENDVLASGAKTLAGMAGWATNGLARAPSGGPLRLVPTRIFGASAPPDDLRVALELDSGAINSFVSRKFSAEPGVHHIRYWYRDGSANRMIEPAWLCATRLEDVDWMKARDADAASDTSLVSAYLTIDVGNVPPTEASLTNVARIDACYNSGARWIERIIKVDIAVRGDYWLTFRAEGRADGRAGAISNMVVCRDPCANDDGSPRPVADNSPWSRDQLLFEDVFSATGDNPIAVSPGRNGAWSSLPSGWTVAPQNSVVYSSAEGFVALDVPTPDGRFGNRLMTRPFLFAPGHYSLRYAYSVGVSQTNGAYCSYFGLPRDPPLLRGGSPDPYSNLVVAFIDSDKSVLHPEANGASPQSSPVWTDARGVRADNLSNPPPPLPLASNAVDFCADMPAGVQAQREVFFNIVRPGYYWISFSGGGAADGQGGRIGQVQIHARDSRDQPLWRVVKDGSEPTPAFSSWIAMPAAGARTLYRVQAQ